MVEQNIGVVLSGLAALFSYLAWVRMTTRSRTEIQETLSNHYSGAEFGVSGYIARIQNVTVTPNQSLEDQIKTNLIPGGRRVVGQSSTLRVLTYFQRPLTLSH